MSRTRNFCVTINNFTEDTISKMQSIEEIRYAIMGKEVAPSTGTPHLQGYIQLHKPKSLKAFQKMLKLHKVNCAAFVAKGTLQQNKKYCGKDGKATEWGEAKTKGQRTDIEELYRMVEQNCDDCEIAKQLPKQWFKYYKAVDKLRQKLREKTARSQMATILSKQGLREWQVNAISELNKQNDRNILWIVDPKGNKGKTWLARYITAVYDGFYVRGGKTSDIAYAYNYQKYITFDFTRQQEEYVNYSCIESFKDGMVFSPKYDSCTKLFKSPKIICMSNFEPDMGKLSIDRWNIVRL